MQNFYGNGNIDQNHIFHVFFDLTSYDHSKEADVVASNMTTLFNWIISFRWKSTVFKAVCVSTLLYALETRALSPATYTKLDRLIVH